MNHRLHTLALAIALLGSIVTPAQAADEPAASTVASVREQYTKCEYRIPMRDGTRLFTVVYVPKDASRRYPFLMERTPYSAGVHADDELHYGVDFYPARLGPSPEFQRSGYIFVQQDVRGRYMSEGKWQEMTPHVNPRRARGEGNESEDMHDTVEWLLKNVPNNNGKVGILGISYPGFYTSASIIDSHPAIKAASPQAPVTDLFMNDDSYHGGAFMLAANFDFYAAFVEAQNPTPLPKSWSNFDYGTPDGYDFFLSHLTLSNITDTMTASQRALLMPTIANWTYNDFWKSRNIAAHLKNIKAAVLTVGGWYDAEDLQGPLTTYHAIKRNNPSIYSGLVMGPWSHGAWRRYDGQRLGSVQFGAKTGEYFRKNIEFPFFEQHLKGVANPNKAEVHAFETGSNVWREYAAWPPKQAQARTLYLGANGTLAWQQPAAGGEGFDEYVADPRKPVPYTGYPAIGVPKEYMVGDQRFASSRTDVLTYRSEPLEEDVTLSGPVKPRLFVSTSGTDADWIVKLIDVYPDDYPSADKPDSPRTDVGKPAIPMAGYQQLVRGDPLRGKFRNGFEQPEPFTPGKVEPVNFSMTDINHTFRRGHRIMVQIQSSWFPLVDLNPQTFVDIPKARPEDFRKATQRVYRAPSMFSGIEVQVLPGPR